ncbi:MAG: hypothetical protein DRQ62_10000 [Gammaproteobacteria bacterium]|nr:MAG: hypothetical protein DRQ62_10000 [Gammaproteobacteria bacterium]
MTSSDVSELDASVWLFDDIGDLVQSDQFWCCDLPSLGVGGPDGNIPEPAVGTAFIGVSAWYMLPVGFPQNMNDWEDVSFPQDATVQGDYQLNLSGARAVPAPPVLWLLSAGLLVFFRARKKLV